MRPTVGLTYRRSTTTLIAGGLEQLPDAFDGGACQVGHTPLS
ncbi:hypothetical protein GFS60_07523 (plasmid) [Rhodococcus sp. WAY2]|nr:hypothetical protein GFS60_07523 [Rhodococcus sp. WAY2]